MCLKRWKMQSLKPFQWVSDLDNALCRLDMSLRLFNGTCISFNVFNVNKLDVHEYMLLKNLDFKRNVKLFSTPPTSYLWKQVSEGGRWNESLIWFVTDPLRKHRGSVRAIAFPGGFPYSDLTKTFISLFSKKYKRSLEKNDTQKYYFST